MCFTPRLTLEYNALSRLKGKSKKAEKKKKEEQEQEQAVEQEILITKDLGRSDIWDRVARERDIRQGIDLATTLERIEKNFVVTDPRLPDNPIVSFRSSNGQVPNLCAFSICAFIFDYWKKVF